MKKDLSLKETGIAGKLVSSYTVTSDRGRLVYFLDVNGAEFKLSEVRKLQKIIETHVARIERHRLK